MKANELELKAKALNTLRADRRITKKSVISSELPLPERGIRADLAIAAGRRLIGIEIKSDFDSLRRLDRQLSAYTKAFDETILLLGEKHSGSINLSAYGDIHVWGVEDNSVIKLNSPKIIMARRNPSVERREMLELFNDRFAETSAAFWEKISGRRIEASDIPLLSRYHEIREEKEKKKREFIELWTSWNKEETPK